MGFIQKVTGKVNSAQPLTLTLNGVTAGNALILTLNDIGQAFTGGTISGWTAAVNPAAAGSPAAKSSIWYKLNVSGGTQVATVGYTAGTFAGGCLTEWSGLIASPLDPASTTASVTAGQTLTVGPTAALAQANNVVFAVIGLNSNSTSTNIGLTDPPSGYTSLVAYQNMNADACGGHGYLEVTSTTGVSAVWNWSDSSTHNSRACIAVFGQSGSAPVGPVIMGGMCL